MSMWEKPLTRENIDEFFRLFAPPAYRSTYKILGDTTRTENAMTEAFLEVYHQRNSDDAGDLVFLFSDILQRRVETLATHYPISETTQIANRNLDEFTENSILAEIHHRLDSTPYRILELFTSSAGKSNMRADPILGQIQKSGITLFLILQLIVVAAIIFAITSASARNVFGIDDIVPQSPGKVEFSIEDVLVPALNYLPLSITGQTQPDALTTESGTNSSDTVSGTETTLTTSSAELTVASATRG